MHTKTTATADATDETLQNVKENTLSQRFQVYPHVHLKTGYQISSCLPCFSNKKKTLISSLMDLKSKALQKETPKNDQKIH
ncbi:CLUMA_CG021506, isoform A [Clunio marinus]|uniref:CLUMA_CG021506, isoform A n=1 Tax=Clunio marinus TaxID=568069 RepID=A0A1J1J9M0_9DIPT|nr:CLUMA_CG021506, isoform A [Clunio marinus]